MASRFGKILVVPLQVWPILVHSFVYLSVAVSVNAILIPVQ